MGLSVIEIKPGGQRKLVITVASEDRNALKSAAARDLAIRHATPQLGRCGFDTFGDWGYLNPPDAANPNGRVLAEADMGKQGAREPGGLNTQEIVVMAGI